MMKFILISIFFFLFTGCSAAGSQDSANAVATLSTYLQAFVDKNEAQMSTLLCKEWSQDALLEYDAFQGVGTTLEGLTCSVSSVEEETILASCQGKIQASYQNEIQEFDLSQRVYRMQKSGVDWLVCGYTTP
jgi:hypothetical protein